MTTINVLRALARDDRGTAAIEYATNLAAAALIAIAGLALTYSAVQATYHQAELHLNDTSRAPVLCAGPVRQSPTGGSC